jgi:uncharacterized protein YacL
MLLTIVRVVFVLIPAGIAAYFAYVTGSAAVFILSMTMILGVVALDWSFPSKQISVIAAIFFGLLIGLVLASLLQLALGPIISTVTANLEATQGDHDLQSIINSAVYLHNMFLLCYLSISLLLQTKDDFRFIIPYVEFAREIKGFKPLVLDTSVIIDGRIADIAAMKLLDNSIVVPSFVLHELHGIADSSDRQRRSRGRRGLDILDQMRANPNIDVELHDNDLPELADKPVDERLVLLAKHLGGKVVTNDYNLNKIASLQGVEVVNLNDVANALKPVFLPGELIDVRIIKAGEEAHQGIGYLEDGTMVVVEQGRNSIGKEAHIQVTSVLQTSAGRMVFGKIQE